MRERRRWAGRRQADHVAQVAFEEAFIALTDGVVITDAEGKIVSANPASFRVLGEDKLIDQTFDDLLLVSGATTIERSDTHSVRRSWFPRDERMGVLEIVSTAMPSSGAIHTVRDVTAQAELLRLKEDFLLQVAHELRTPIAAMSASLDLVEQDALSMPREQLRSMVSTLRRSAYRLEHLVENLLDAGSIEAGTLQMHIGPASLKQALQESLLSVGPLADLKSQSVVVNLEPEADRIVADARRTAQVFSNVISNASKYAPENTTIQVSASAGEGFATVTVRDQGPGIPPDELPRLFQRFFRSRDVREAAGGLGLGLSICRVIVQAQGGQIRIESTEGEGTAVHFTVPRARELAEEVVS